MEKLNEEREPKLFLLSSPMLRYTGPMSGTVRNFLENPTRGIAIEATQNAFDNRIDKSQNGLPAVVEFKRVSVRIDEISVLEKLKKIYKESYEYWKKTTSKNRAKEAERFLQVLDNSFIHILLIRDNASGLEGAKTAHPDSGYYALLFSSGATVKDSELSGGSAGEGHYSLIAASDIGSILVSTQTVDGYQGYIGAFSVVPFENENGEMTQNVAYWTDKVNGSPIEGLFSLPGQTERTTSGTDIMVLCFDDDNWESTIIQTIIGKYWLTIRNKRLVVHVGDVVINHETLPVLLQQYAGKKGIGFAQELYEKMERSKPIIEKKPAKKYGNSINFEDESFELELYETVGSEEGIMVVREMEMDMFHLKVPSSCIGVLRIKGESANRFFRKVENVQHDRWIANLYHEDKNQARKAISEVKAFVEEAVKKHFSSSNQGFDAIGLPISLYDQEGEKEVILGKTKQITHSISKKKGPKKGSPGSKNNTTIKFQKVKCINQLLGQYLIELKLTKNTNVGVIEVVAIGEQSNLKQKINKVQIQGITKVDIINDSIHFLTENERSHLIVELQLEEPKFCSLEARYK